MKRQSILLITGWARPPSALAALADALHREHIVRITSPAALLAAHGGPASEEAAAGTPSPYAQALRRLLEESDQPAILAGWSMGGLIALETLAGSPAGIAGLVLLSSTARLCATDGYPCGPPSESLRAMRRSILRAPLAALAEFLTAVHAPETPAPAQLQTEARESLAAGLEVLLHGMAYLATADQRAALAHIRRPALVVHGALDRIIPCTAGQHLARSIPGAIERIDPAAGHALPVARPDETAKNLLDFIRDHVP